MCSVCGGASRSSELESVAVRITRCRGCGHREAWHAPAADASDYYLNTPQSPTFVAALEVTRRRQARKIAARLSELAGGDSGWFDFGFGRGWFLQELRARTGAARVGGFDASPLSRAWGREQGFEVAEPLAGDPFWPDWRSFSFSPRIVSLLDVLEHFPAGQARALLGRLRAELPTLEWIVVKVPVSEGILYRTAHALRRLQPGLFAQLYQVGTFPPHYHYFNRRSLRALLEQTGHDVVDLLADHDVDNIFHRIEGLAWLPGGASATRLIRLFPADSAVAFARIAGAHPGP